MTALTHHFARALEQLDGLRDLENEYTQLSSTHKKLEHTLEEAQTTISMLEAEVSQLADRSSQQTEQAKEIEHLRQELSQEVSRRTTIEKSISKKNEELEQAKVEIYQLEKARKDYTVQHVNLVSQLTETRSVLDKRLQQLAKREIEHSQQKAEIGSYINAQAKLNADNDRQKSEIVELTKWLQSSEALKDTAVEQVKELSLALEQSSAWDQQRELDNRRRDQEIVELSAALLRAESRLKASSVTKKALLAKRARRQLIKEIQTSKLFDGSWYLQRYPDVAASKLPPIEHFLKFGGIEGRDPGPMFSSSAYFEKYPDVRALGLNPLAHYLLEGQFQGCDVTPVDRR